MREKTETRKKPAKKSWEQDAAADGLDLPGEDFDYDEFVAREFGHPPHRKLGVKWFSVRFHVTTRLDIPHPLG